jgi:hypothetical protein
MIRDERLPAQKMGRDWFIKEKDLALVANRKPGRPPITEEEKAARVAKRVAVVTTKPKAPKKAAKKAVKKKESE